jgi:hypothetical protein
MNPALRAALLSHCSVCERAHELPPATDGLGRDLPHRDYLICHACSEARYEAAAARFRRGENPHREVPDDYREALREYGRWLDDPKRRRARGKYKDRDPAQREFDF